MGIKIASVETLPMLVCKVKILVHVIGQHAMSPTSYMVPNISHYRLVDIRLLKYGHTGFTQ